MKNLLSILLLVSMVYVCRAQTSLCGTDEYIAMIDQDSVQRRYIANSELSYQKYMLQHTSRQRSGGRSEVVLPVVFHLIHNNGAENISDAAILQGLTHLNQAFANQGPYQNEQGVDTDIRFCLAQRDEAGNAFSGILRYESIYTDMSLFEGYHYVKNKKLDSTQYLNIQIVKEACNSANCSIAGFAGDHRVVIKAKTLDMTSANASVLIHEIGHYLGLYHTWYRGCKNDDCLKDGDKVCDTPPDNRTFDGCSHFSNSCHTDSDDDSPNNPFRLTALGGIGDQADDQTNFMDYNVNSCSNKFTHGQAERMHFYIQDRYPGLPTSRVCLPPCEFAVTADFDLPDSIAIGQTLTLTNHSTQADSYQWTIDGTPMSTDTDLAYTFVESGAVTVQLVASSSDTLCEPAVAVKTIQVYCPVEACITYAIHDQYLVYATCSETADITTWLITDVQGDTLRTAALSHDSIYVNNIDYVQLCLTASDAYCSDHTCAYITITADGSEVCGNEVDDDSDGLIDLFDPDCPCDDAAYQAHCPSDCEVVPDSFPDIKMKMKWESEVLEDYWASASEFILFNNNEGNVDIVSNQLWARYENLNFHLDSLNLVHIDGTNGKIINSSKIEPSGIASGFCSIDPLRNGNILIYFEDGNSKIRAVDRDLKTVFITDPLISKMQSKIAISDINGDGLPELLKNGYILNSTNGAILLKLPDGVCDQSTCTTSPVIADFTDSPGQEIAMGNRVFDINIINVNNSSGNSFNEYFAPSIVNDGFTSYADLDGDNLLDIIVVGDGTIADGGGMFVWNPKNSNVIAMTDVGLYSSVPSVGDVDNDCIPELALSVKNELRVYKYDATQKLQLLWSKSTDDDFGSSGTSMFDFNQDGNLELIYRDKKNLKIIQGTSGVTLDSFPMYSPTLYEFPVIADIDKDGQAEILVTGHEDDKDKTRIYCFESASGLWAPARSVWNQYAYNPTQVNDDLTIPRYQQNPAQPLQGTDQCPRETCSTPYNNFMVQATTRTQEGCYVWPDDDSCNDEICGNEVDDDGDGLIDLFDPDCPCDDTAYQAHCPSDCEVVPDSFPDIKMKMKWESVKMNIEFAITISKNVVGDVDEDGKIEILNGYSRGERNAVSNYIAYLDGNTGTIVDTLPIFPEYKIFEMPVSPIIVNTHTNGIYLYAYNLGELACFDSDGNEVFRSSHPSIRNSPAVADFNGDGIPEIYCGDVIFNGLTGDILYVGRDRDCSIGGSCRQFTPVAADVIGNDNIPELITGKYVYQVNITNTTGTLGNTANIIEAPSGVEDGRCAVGDLDGDGLLDIIVQVPTHSPYGITGALSVWNPRTLTLMDTQINPTSFGTGDFIFEGGMPFVGDINADCTPEIGVVYHRMLRMYTYTPTNGLEILYEIPTTDDSGFTGVTMFDFNQDGQQELVYRDESSLRVIAGATGTTLDSFPLLSGTGSEYPIVADVDLDGEAEIVVSGSLTSQDEVRVYCFESASGLWAPARSVWNQYAYNPTQVNDDLTIPRYQQNPAQPLQGTDQCPRETCSTPYNNFMVQATTRTQEGCYVWESDNNDITVSASSQCIGDSLEICFYVEWADTLGQREIVPVACYPPYRDNGANAIDIVYVYDTTCVLMPSTFTDWDSLFIIANDSGSGYYPPSFPNTSITECDYTNNEFVLPLGGPDFSIEVVDWECSPDSLIFYIATDNVGLDTDVSCIGGGCYFTDPSIEPMDGSVVTPIEYTNWCFDYDSTSMTYQYQDTFRVAIPHPEEKSEMWWTINEGGFGPNSESANVTGVYECDYSNNVDSISFDLSEQVLDLGPDITKCGTAILTLDAGPNFETYLWSDLTTDSSYSAIGGGLHIVETTDQCGRVYRDTVEVTIDYSSDVDLGPNIELCYEQDTTLTVMGTYDQVFWSPSDAVVCDTCMTTTVVIDSSTTTITIQARQGECISYDTLIIEQIVPQIDSQVLQLCPGDTTYFYGMPIVTAGHYDTLLPDCSRLSMLDVSFGQLDTTYLYESICATDSLLFDEDYIRVSGDYTLTTSNEAGCDSVVILHLDVLEQMLMQDSIAVCAGDSVLLFGEWIYRDTTIEQSYVSTTSGCDSIQSYVVTVSSLPSHTYSHRLCEGDSMYLYDKWYTTAGNYDIIIDNPQGCDSLISLELTQLTSVATYDTLAACQGDTVIVFNTQITESQAISQAFSATNGCDSISNYYVDFGLSFDITEEVLLCPDDSLLIDGQWVTTAGQYTTQYTSVGGCDSTRTVVVYRVDNPPMPETEVDCAALVVSLSIDPHTTWTPLWSNGDTTYQTQYPSGIHEAELMLHAEPNCDQQMTITLPDVPTLDDMPAMADTLMPESSTLLLDMGLDTSQWSITWSPAEIVDCVTCMAVELTPTTDTEVTVYLEHQSGCTYESTFVIELRSIDGNINVPNVFLPLGERTNSTWTVFKSPDIEIRNCTIYDRWGSQVYASTDKIPHWDGRFDGRYCEAGVYVYVITYIDAVGDEQTLVGDVTLLK